LANYLDVVKMKKLMMIIILISFMMNEAKIFNIIKNHDFQRGYNDWETNIEKDGEKDFEKPKIIKENTENVLIFKNKTYKKRVEGLIQANFDKVKKLRSNFLVTYSHSIKNFKKEYGDGLFYINVRYKDGTFLPIYQFISNFENHLSYEKECLIIPNFKKIENIVYSISVYNNYLFEENDFYIKVKNLGILFDDSYKIENSEGKINIKKEIKKCKYIKTLERKPLTYNTDPNVFNSLISPVS
jgi:hypothetical protein